MSIILDLFGSAIIGGYVILIGMRMLATMGDTIVASGTTVSTQESMVDAIATMESDFRKIGYGVTEAKNSIAIADSNRIRFRADMNRDGSVDSVEWYLGPRLAKFTDRSVHYLFRRYNGGQPMIAAANVVYFRLRYLDQTGNPTAFTTNIAMIETTLELSSQYKVVDQVNPDSLVYAKTMWRQTRLASRNLTRHG